MVFCQLSEPTDIQNNESLKPSNWLKNHENCYQNIEIESELTDNFFIPYCEKVIDKMLEQVSSEMTFDAISAKYVDHVSYIEVVDRYPNTRICTNCNKMCPKDDNTCVYCTINARIPIDLNAMMMYLHAM